jgi:hypothetical protein
MTTCQATDATKVKSTYEALPVLKATSTDKSSTRRDDDDDVDNVLLISNLVSFAYKAFFVPFAHVHKQFVVVKEALATERTQWMDAAFDGFLERLFGRAMGYRR